ncbi:MAG: tetratricopeptide repeat protein [Nanoarchaeota archaeon]|nr:tetratricopeptide repeat protein [Nanoarchaeota archaeon]
MKLSLCMITKNEEEFLEKCLNSVRGLVDEIIIVDTGSSDKTKEIAASFDAKVFDFKWCDDFSAARNESLKHATGDWVLVLDADETLAEKDKEKIKKIISEAKDYEVGFVLKQRNYYNLDEEAVPLGWISAKDDSYEESKGIQGWLETPAVRLFRNVPGMKYNGVVHECVSEFLKNKGKIEYTKIPFHHFGKLKVESRKKKSEMYERLGKKKLEGKKDYYNYYELARQCVGNGKLDEAIDLLKKSIELKGDFWQSWFNLGSVYLMKDDLEKALDALNRAIELNPEDVDILSNLGVVLAKKGDFVIAKEKFEAGLRLNPNNAGVCFNLGKIYHKLGDLEMARLALARAKELDPRYTKRN